MVGACEEDGVLWFQAVLEVGPPGPLFYDNLSAAQAFSDWKSLWLLFCLRSFLIDGENQVMAVWDCLCRPLLRIQAGSVPGILKSVRCQESCGC